MMLKTLRMVAVIVSLGSAGSASAQSLNDDVKCFLLSTGMAKQAAQQNVRNSATLAAAFYLGRIDGRALPAALKAAVRAQGTGMDGASAGKAMQACAARAEIANKTLTGTIREAQTPHQ